MAFVSSTAADWLLLNVQVWVTAFFMQVVCYGVGRQLIKVTSRRPLSAPVAALSACSRQWAARRMSQAIATVTFLPSGSKASTDFPSNPAGTTPAVALLTGAAPLLE